MRNRKTLFLSTLLVLAPLTASAQQFSATGGFGFLQGGGQVPFLPADLPAGATLDYDNDDIAFTASFAWHMNDAWALEAWMTWPSQRNVEVDPLNAADVPVATYDVRPVMLSMQYRFPTMANRYRPFAGLGWQWTRIADEQINPNFAAIAPMQLDGDDGLAAVAGVDIDLNDTWFIRGDIRYLDSNVHSTYGPAALTMSSSANTTFYGASIGARF